MSRMRLKTGEIILLDPPDEAKAREAGGWYLQTYRTYTRVVRSGTREREDGVKVKTTIHLSTFLIGKAPAGSVWIHRNGNRLDYRRANLIAARKGLDLTKAGKDSIIASNRHRSRERQAASPDQSDKE